MERYAELVNRFRTEFPGEKPAFLIRVPGRVNLIGEHTDYNGLPVMPMAMSRAVHVVVGAARPGEVQLRNVDKQFGQRQFAISDSIPPYPTGDWGNYVKAGVQGVVDLERGKGGRGLSAFSMLVESDLPMAAGLSSSSAVVVAAALATLSVNDISWDRAELAEQMAAAERYVGTMGGGMDHAAVLLAESGSALRIDFFPLRTRPVPLPAGYSIVVCNSFVKAPKTAAARLQYNRRPVECRLATAILAQHLSLASQAERISDLLRFVPAEQLLAAAEEVFGRESWSRERAAAALGFEVPELEQRYLLLRDGQVMPQPADGFPFLTRVRHVVTEGERVNAAERALRAGDVAVFAELMDRSHASCRDDYGISCPELEALVQIARESGALGSRLTGAGFGGCTVSLLPAEQVESFTAAVSERYYGRYLSARRPELVDSLQAVSLRDLVIPTTAEAGASVTALD